jgi:hypothetical protein
MPCTRHIFSLELHFSFNGQQVVIQVAQALIGEISDFASVLLVTYAAAHALRTGNIPGRLLHATPLPGELVPLNSFEEPLSARVFQTGHRICKVFDKGDQLARKPNIELIRSALGDEYLPNLELQEFDDGVQMLFYDKTDGCHTPSAPVTQFAVLCRDLLLLHGSGNVHGDIRRVNLLFGEASRILDFDLAAPEGSLYPSSFANLQERHPDAIAQSPMRYTHDWHSMAEVMMLEVLDEQWKSKVDMTRKGQNWWSEVFNVEEKEEGSPSEGGTKRGAMRQLGGDAKRKKEVAPSSPSPASHLVQSSAKPDRVTAMADDDVGGV